MLGIDLDSNGPDNPPDPLDPDPGANNKQNIPKLLTAVAGPITTSVTGTYNSTINTPIYLQFFVSPQADASGFGEGKTFVLTAPINTGPTGTLNFGVDLPLIVTNGYFITATATVYQPGGSPTLLSSSEFSNAQVVTGPPPTVTISDVSVNEGNSGPTNAVFTVTLSDVYSQTVTVSYTTADGTAVAPGDYLSQTSTLTFLPGETSKTITIAVNGDTTVEPTETFLVNLTAATNAVINDPQGVGTIKNDDAAAPAPTPKCKIECAPDPCDPKKTCLKITGTDSSDKIEVYYGGSQGKVHRQDQRTSQGTYSFTGNIVVYGNKRRRLRRHREQDHPQRLHLRRRRQRHHLRRRRTQTSLVGGRGNDKCYGDSNRDICIGGQGADCLDAGPARTASSPAAPATTIRSRISASSRRNGAAPTRATRPAAPISTAARLLRRSQVLRRTLIDDAEIDTCKGGSSNDAFWSNTTGGTKKDTFSDRSSSETCSDLI